MKKEFFTRRSQRSRRFSNGRKRITVQSKSVFLGDLCDLCVESLGERGGRHSRTYEERIFHTEIAKITKIFEWPERVTVQSKSVFLGDLCDLCVWNLSVDLAAAIRGPMKKNFSHGDRQRSRRFSHGRKRITVQSKSVFLGDLCDLCVESLGGRGGRHSRTYEERIFHTEIAKITKIFEWPERVTVQSKSGFSW